MALSKAGSILFCYHLIAASKFRNELVAYGSSFIPKFCNASLTNLQNFSLLVYKLT